MNIVKLFDGELFKMVSENENRSKFALEIIEELEGKINEIKSDDLNDLREEIRNLEWRVSKLENIDRLAIGFDKVVNELSDLNDTIEFIKDKMKDSRKKRVKK